MILKEDSNEKVFISDFWFLVHVSTYKLYIHSKTNAHRLGGL